MSKGAYHKIYGGAPLKRMIFALIAITMMFFAACSNTPEKDTGTSEGTTSYTSASTSKNSDGSKELKKDPIYDVKEEMYDIYFRHDHGDIVGYGNNFYLKKGETFYLLLELDVPVSLYGNVFSYDIDENGVEEIIVYDFEGKRTAILIYLPDKDMYDIYVLKGMAYILDFYDIDGYRLYAAQREEYPYTLELIKLAEGKLDILDVAEATGNEYAVIAQGQYLFAGTRDSLHMYILDNGVFIEIDAELYLAKENIIENSSRELLEIDDLKMISRHMLKLAVDEIYARNGYVFEDDSYSSYYFERYPWYIKDEGFKKEMASEVEKKNIDLINGYLKLLDDNISVYEDMAAKTDLDGDGKTEDIRLKIDEDKMGYELIVGSLELRGTGDFLIEKLYIFDLDKNDDNKEIAISEAGPSDDYAIYIYRYDKEKIIFMGRIEGTGDDMSADGSGQILTYRRGSILQTWFYPFVFKEDKAGMLKGVEEAEYKMDTFVIVQKDLEVYASPTDKNVKFKLRAKEPALIVSSDDKSWCRIRDQYGEEGFFFVENFAQINGVDAQEYFSGLSYAD